MNQWIPITAERKPTEADADDRGFVYVTNLVGWVSRRHWKDLQLYENLLAWHPKQKTPSPYIPASQYRPAVMPDDYGQFAHFAAVEGFPNYLEGELSGRHSTGNAVMYSNERGQWFPFCRIPVPATVEEEAKADCKWVIQSTSSIPNTQGMYLSQIWGPDMKFGKQWCSHPKDALQFDSEEQARGFYYGNALRGVVVVEFVPASSPSQPEPTLLDKVPSESSPAVDWSKAPEWAMWVAMDANGRWYFYSSQPTIIGVQGDYWGFIANDDRIYKSSAFSYCGLSDPAWNDNWRSSLQPRPVPSPAPIREDKQAHCDHGWSSDDESKSVCKYCGIAFVDAVAPAPVEAGSPQMDVTFNAKEMEVLRAFFEVKYHDCSEGGWWLHGTKRYHGEPRGFALKEWEAFIEKLAPESVARVKAARIDVVTTPVEVPAEQEAAQ